MNTSFVRTNSCWDASEVYGVLSTESVVNLRISDISHTILFVVL